jgi:hypothetical protein
MLNKIDFPGKPDEVQTCQFDFWITPVIVVDNLIYTVDQIQTVFGSDLDYKLEFFSELLFKIQIDNELIFQTTFQELNPQRLTKTINDLIEQQHELAFILEGKNNNHSCFLGADKKSVTLSVQIVFAIEQLPAQTLFYEHGKYITQDHGCQSASTVMGNNGKQILQFPCPIYPWLLANSKAIISDLVTQSC